MKPVYFFLLLSACSADNSSDSTMLLMGNSFFRPYAEHLDTLAIDAGFDEHASTIVTRGGENGQPINFWNDDTTVNINKSNTLDQGRIELFGMTSGHDYEQLDDRIEGIVPG